MRIVVTRPAGQEHELVELLTAIGHEVVSCPVIAIEPVGDEPIHVDRYDWVVVTSVNGARELLRRAVGAMPRLAAVGQATAAALGGADLVPSVSTQEGLLAELPRPAGRVLFAGAEGSRPLLATELDADVVTLYRTRELPPDPPPHGDLVVLASPSAARAFAAAVTSIPCATIGPETTRAAQAAGLRVLREAATHDTAGLVAAVERLAESERAGASLRPIL